MTKPAGGATPSRTPAKSNYALPHTPIASAKRPRSSMPTSQGLPATPLTPSNHKMSTLDNDTALSPMHPARPRVIQEELCENGEDAIEGGTSSKLVDAIFSPMLKFLSGNETEEDEEVKTDDRGDTDQLRQNEEDKEEPAMEENAVVDLNAQEDVVLSEADEVSSQGSEDDDEEDEFNPYAFIKALPSYENVKSLRPTIALPAKDIDAKPISLVLDLDETLVHCTVEACDNANFNFPVEFHGMTYQVYVRLRPYLTEFLESVYKKFEVIVFTASQQVYADALLNRIDPEHKYIRHRMFRESCLSVEGNFLKDLNVLGRDLKKSVLVDNSPHAFGYQVDNGVPIESWFDDPEDTELLKLERFLSTLHGHEDVRTVVRRTFQTYKLIEQAPSTN